MLYFWTVGVGAHRQNPHLQRKNMQSPCRKSLGWDLHPSSTCCNGIVLTVVLLSSPKLKQIYMKYLFSQPQWHIPYISIFVKKARLYGHFVKYVLSHKYVFSVLKFVYCYWIIEAQTGLMLQFKIVDDGLFLKHIICFHIFCNINKNMKKILWIFIYF